MNFNELHSRVSQLVQNCYSVCAMEVSKRALCKHTIISRSADCAVALQVFAVKHLPSNRSLALSRSRNASRKPAHSTSHKISHSPSHKLAHSPSHELPQAGSTPLQASMQSGASAQHATFQSSMSSQRQRRVPVSGGERLDVGKDLQAQPEHVAQATDARRSSHASFAGLSCVREPSGNGDDARVGLSASELAELEVCSHQGDNTALAQRLHSARAPNLAQS